MNKRFLLISIIGLFLIILSACSSESHVVIKVVDESGNPLKDMSIEGNQGNSDGKSEIIYKGFTNDEGIFHFGPGPCGRSGFVIFMEKPGWYKNRLEPRFDHYDKESGKWLPYPFSVTVVAKPILNPVAMYAKNSLAGIHDMSEMDERIPSNRRTYTLIPETRDRVGYDLTKGDWVKPHGIGEQADMYFQLQEINPIPFRDPEYIPTQEEYEALFNYRLHVTFPGAADGIQPVEMDRWTPLSSRQTQSLYLPRYAPLHGYQPTREFYWAKEVDQSSEVKERQIVSSYSPLRGYFFRVRSKRIGDQVDGWYGKMNEDIQFSPIRDEKQKKFRFRIDLSYHLNPEGTRNMEFDPKKNLISPLIEKMDDNGRVYERPAMEYP